MEFDVSILDGVIKKTIQAVETSQEQIFEIAEGARQESRALQQELADIRQEILDVIANVDQLEQKYRQSRARLVIVSRDFRSFSEEDIRQAYEEANDVQTQLSLARERELHLRRQRDDLERRLRNLEQTIVKAEKLVTQMGIVLGYLTGDLSKVDQVVETAKQHQLLGLKIIQAQEEERKRVAREIHDGPAQTMANVVLRADIVERMLKNEQLEQAIVELQSLKEMIRISLADVRRIIFDLRPMALDDLGLVPTLQKYIQTYQERTGLDAEMVVFGKENNLGSSFKVAVFRLVQECLNNVYKHAKAKRVQVKIEFQEEHVFLVVKDDGIGFRMEETSRRGNSFGIMGMKERMEQLQGRMELTSAPLKGTKVFFQIPLKAK